MIFTDYSKATLHFCNKSLVMPFSLKLGGQMGGYIKTKGFNSITITSKKSEMKWKKWMFFIFLQNWANKPDPLSRFLNKVPFFFRFFAFLDLIHWIKFYGKNSWFSGNTQIDFLRHVVPRGTTWYHVAPNGTTCYHMWRKIFSNFFLIIFLINHSQSFLSEWDICKCI